MAGSAILVVGARGMGKTTYIKNMLNKVHPSARIVYDVNGEYSDFYKEKFNTDFEMFVEKTNKVRNAVIVFEEATIFLSYGGSPQAVRELLVKARHTGNTIIFVFHSLRSIPRYLFDLCNYVVLHKTNDSEGVVQYKFENEEFTEIFLKVKNADFLTSNGKKYSPHVVYSIY